MMYLDKDLPDVGIAAGSLDDDTQMPRLVSHDFVKEKVAWYEIPDDGVKRCQAWHE